MEELGIPRGSYVVKVNNRKVLDGLMEAIGISGEENAGKRLIVLRAIDKLDRLGPEAVFLLLTKGRKDESGDFTKGAGLSELHATFVLTTVGVKVYEQVGPASPLYDAFVELNDRVRASVAGSEGLQQLREIDSLIGSGGTRTGSKSIKPSSVPGILHRPGVRS
jgi:histidyl-tRNA synthetase